MEIKVSFDSDKLQTFIKDELEIIKKEIETDIQSYIRKIVLEMPELREYRDKSTEIIAKREFLRECIVIACETATSMKLDDMKTESRVREYVMARYCYMYCLRKYTDLSLVEIGKAFGKDHTTIINGIKRCEDALFVKNRKDILYTYLIRAIEIITTMLKERNLIHLG